MKLFSALSSSSNQKKRNINHPFVQISDSYYHKDSINLTIKDLNEIASIIEKNKLHALYLPHCQIGDKGVAILVEALKKNHSLTSLCLPNNAITDEGAKMLLDVLKVNTTIFSLDVFDNAMDVSYLIEINKICALRYEEAAKRNKMSLFRVIPIVTNHDVYGTTYMQKRCTFQMPVSFFKLNDEVKREFVSLLDEQVRISYFNHLIQFNKMPEGNAKQDFYKSHTLIAQQSANNLIQKYLSKDEGEVNGEIHADYALLIAEKDKANQEYAKSLVFDESLPREMEQRHSPSF